jgi:ABC-type dipeptide/oligopeptide/nickel transport system permease component
MIPVFFGASLLVFLIVFALPGDPVRAIGGPRILPEATIRAIEERYRLDEPIAVQYLAYMGDLLQGDLGESYVSRRPIRDIFAETFPNTARLALLTIVIELVIGIGAGILAALRKRGFLDMLVLVSTTLAISIPIFVIGFTLQLLVGVKWGILPVAGLSEGFRSYLLPAFVLASVSLAYLARLTRTGLVDTLGEDYVRTAEAKGLPRRRVVGRHALRNSILPVMTFLAIDFAFLLGGAIVVEGIFNINGIGNTVFRAISQRDNLLIISFTLLAVVLFMIVSLIIDLVHVWLDPRLRYE